MTPSTQCMGSKMTQHGLLRAVLALFVSISVCVEVMAASEPQTYQLGVGDQLKVTVFGEPDLSGNFTVDDQGTLSLPLIGIVAARGLSLRALEQSITKAYLDGYLKKPRINVEMTNYRPFYILGEVNFPGSYPYVNGMNVLKAVALAGGFTYRAKEKELTIRRAGEDENTEAPAVQETIVLPGDIIRVPERLF